FMPCGLPARAETNHRGARGVSCRPPRVPDATGGANRKSVRPCNAHRTGRDSMAPDERPVAELLKELSEQTSALVRQEVELAKLELTEKGKRAGIGAGMFGGASLVGLYALGALTAAIILILA